MFCRNCGAEVHQNAVACPKCGVPPLLEKKFCYECGAETKANQIICIKCGVKLMNKGSIGSIGSISSIGTGKRPIIPFSFALAIICFFLSFCVFSCGGQKNRFCFRYKSCNRN